MWQYREFKTKADLDNWTKCNKDKYQIEEIFVENSYCVTYKKLTIISFE